MDAKRFDQLTRLLTLSSRRRVLGAIGGLSALPALFGTELAVAKRKKKRCKRGQVHCGSKRKCFDLQSDRKHCGSCSTTCNSGDLCIDGECVVGPGDCPANADSCSETDTVPCNDNPDCSCYQRLEGGVRCVQFLLPIGECDQCETDADCVALGFPVGSSCIKDDGPSCTCLADNRGYCGEPCGFVPMAARTGARIVAGPHR
jgi:hypothetical protein